MKTRTMTRLGRASPALEFLTRCSLVSRYRDCKPPSSSAAPESMEVTAQSPRRADGLELHAVWLLRERREGAGVGRRWGGGGPGPEQRRLRFPVSYPPPTRIYFRREAASTRGEMGLVMARQTQTSVLSTLHKRSRCQIFRCLQTADACSQGSLASRPRAGPSVAAKNQAAQQEVSGGGRAKLHLYLQRLHGRLSSASYRVSSGARPSWKLEPCCELSPRGSGWGAPCEREPNARWPEQGLSQGAEPSEPLRTPMTLSREADRTATQQIRCSQTCQNP